MGSQCSCLREGLACSALGYLSMSLAAEFCTCWCGLMTVSVDSPTVGNCSSLIWIANVLAASSVIY